jgi:hypothetical protein
LAEKPGYVVVGQETSSFIAMAECGKASLQNDLQAAPTFLTLPTASFIVNGAKPASDLAVVTAGRRHLVDGQVRRRIRLRHADLRRHRKPSAPARL